MDIKRLFEATKLLVLFSASFHILILVIYAIMKQDFMYLNYFNILDLDFFLPQILELNHIYSVIFMLSLYVSIYFFLAKKSG